MPLSETSAAENTKRRARRFQFRLNTLLALTLGVAIGFAPLKLWEVYSSPQPQIQISVLIVETTSTELLANEFKEQPFSSSWIGRVDSEHGVRQLLQKLQKESKAHVLSRPTLMTLSGQPATVMVGTELPVLREQEDELVTEYFTEGVNIAMTPTLQRNHLIHLTIQPEISEVDLKTTDDQAPAMRKSGFESSVELASGETYALGSLSTPTAKDGRSLVILVTPSSVK